MSLIKKYCKVFAIAFVLCFLFIVAPVSAKTTNAKLNTKSVSICVGNSYTLKVKNAKKVQWKTSNKKIATVKKGKVKALKTGKVTITAKVGKKKLTCQVKVVAVLSRKDFAVEFPGDNGKYYTNCIDYFVDGGYESDYLYAEGSDKTVRGIGLGVSKATVLKKYGYKKSKNFNFTSAVIASVFDDLDMTDSNSYCEYTYDENGVTYQILFFFNKNNKVTHVLLGKGLIY